MLGYYIFRGIRLSIAYKSQHFVSCCDIILYSTPSDIIFQSATNLNMRFQSLTFLLAAFVAGSRALPNEVAAQGEGPVAPEAAAAFKSKLDTRQGVGGVRTPIKPFIVIRRY